MARVNITYWPHHPLALKDVILNIEVSWTLTFDNYLTINSSSFFSALCTSCPSKISLLPDKETKPNWQPRERMAMNTVGTWGTWRKKWSWGSWGEQKCTGESSCSLQLPKRSYGEVRAMFFSRVHGGKAQSLWTTAREDIFMTVKHLNRLPREAVETKPFLKAGLASDESYDL